MKYDTDRKHIWHPYTSVKHPSPVNGAEYTEGTKITLEDGTVLTDAISSWWSAAHGHRPEKVVQAIRKQAEKMPHIIFAGFTHNPAITLAEKLTEILPEGLDRIFYADSGSIAVECALKMAIQYQAASGHPERCRIAALRGGYHGDTIGAMSVSDPGGMHSMFRGILPKQYFADRPACRFGDVWEERDFLSMEKILAEHHGEIAGVIAEPVFQGGNGMWFYHPEYLKKLRSACDKYGIVLIFDEIATGFGRTGKRFAAEYAGVVPDVMCIGKALTAGCITMACAVASGKIADPIKVFLHGPTFMANPLACAAAAASMDLFREYDWQGKVAAIERKLKTGLARYAELPNVKDVRALGAVGVLEVERLPSPEKIQETVLKTGVWLRPFDRYIYTMPPFVTTEAELEKIVEAMGILADVR